MKRSYEFIVKDNQSSSVKVKVTQQEPDHGRREAFERQVDLINTLTEDESSCRTGGHNMDNFTMKNLRKAPAQAIEHLEADEEIDDMPFVGKSSKNKVKAPMVGAKTRANEAFLEPLPVEPSATHVRVESSDPERKKVAGVSKLAEPRPPVPAHDPAQHVLDGLMKSVPSTSTLQANSATFPVSIIARPEENQERDWLLDPVNLYMRGMAHRRE